VIKCHRKFRVVLSMDPQHDEDSRAMRNRCVEVAIANGPDYPREYIDAMHCLWREGLRLPLVETSILD
jgi:hypothetical protein